MEYILGVHALNETNHSHSLTRRFPSLLLLLLRHLFRSFSRFNFVPELSQNSSRDVEDVYFVLAAGWLLIGKVEETNETKFN